MVTPKITSPSGSLKGWKFTTFLIGNLKVIKELAKILVPAVSAWLITYNPVWTTIVAVAGKAILDIIEFYAKEYTAEEYAKNE